MTVPVGDLKVLRPLLASEIEALEPIKSLTKPDPQKIFKCIKTLQRTLYGKVTLGVHLATGRTVAIKQSRKDLFLSKRTTDGAKVLENPLEEIRIMRMLSNLHHSGASRVIKLLGELECKRYHWTIFEYAEGGEVFGLLSHGLVGERRARKIFAQLVEGVQFLHRHNICHLDLSLENVLLDGNSDVKICDFGVARELQHEGFKFNTREPPERPGKLNYMAPEVYSGAPFCGKKADVFTIGVDLFLLLTGVLPFQLPALTDPCFEVVVRGNLRHLLRTWKMVELVPPLALDLLSHMLVWEPPRWNIDQVAAHPWVSELIGCND